MHMQEEHVPQLVDHWHLHCNLSTHLEIGTLKNSYTSDISLYYWEVHCKEIPSSHQNGFQPELGGAGGQSEAYIVGPGNLGGFHVEGQGGFQMGVT